jgi:SagB-type dehydrogenase family enzyme
LLPPGITEEEVVDSVLRAGGAEALARFHHHLHRLTQRGLLLRSAHAGGERLATLVPISPGFTFSPTGVQAEMPYLLSRFAYLRREGGEMVLESPRAHARLILKDERAAALVCCLGRAATAAELAGRVPGLTAEAAAGVLTLLAAAGMVQQTGGGIPAEDERPELQTWEFHDLLFHARSRVGRHDGPMGGTFRFVGRLDQPPALKPAGAGETHALFRPDLAALAHEDVPLTRVLEGRNSVRRYAPQAITDCQLGEFLYRVARAREYHEYSVDTPRGPVRLASAPRPYPVGGGLYELEVYAVVRSCAGLAPGLYHYQPLEHRLGRISGATAEVEELLQGASEATGIASDSLQVLLILTARFGRIAWKYSSIAYALTLKHVGVVYQTMYLVATAMGLAPCAVGCGDADVFARAAGTDYYSETSVGEFLLGSKE